MNDLLHELHASACLYARDLHRDSGDVVAWEQCMAEKFAELIVRECVETLGTHEDYWTHEQSMSELKKHFGVEE